MSATKPLIPRQPVPDLKLNLAGGGQWHLGSETPEKFSLLVFYRGWHCPICRKQLQEFQNKLDAFEALGTRVTAITTDPQDRADAMKEEHDFDRLPIAYGLTLEQARDWGLFISTSRGTTSVGVTEPFKFAEPGLFLIRENKTLYFSSIQTMPFARPHVDDILNALKFVLEKDYPARGEVTDL